MKRRVTFGVDDDGSVAAREEALVAALCREALRMVGQAALGKQLSLSTTVDQAVSAISADERRLKQILVNLLSNAVKFTPAGGRVTVQARRLNGAAGRPGKPEEWAEVSVTDTGMGIPPDELPRLFDRFWQGSHARRADTIMTSGETGISPSKPRAARSPHAFFSLSLQAFSR